MIGIWVVVAGAAGSLARFELAGFLQRLLPGTRPWGTAGVNLLGAFLLGLVSGMAPPGSPAAEVLGLGFLGGFTTFSTWMVESIHLLEEGGRSGLVSGLVNLVGMLVAGVIGAALGIEATRSL